MRELTDAERVVAGLEYERILIRRKGDSRFVRGRCLAVGGRGGADGPDGAMYVLLEVPANAEVVTQRELNEAWGGTKL